MCFGGWRSLPQPIAGWMWLAWSGFVCLCGPLIGCRQPEPVASEQTAAADEIWQGKIVLGSPSLTQGIPGSGPLQVADVRQWLASADNHAPLELVLPLGLRSAENEHVFEGVKFTRAKIELGRQLFFDKRLSKHEGLSCGDCHNPARQFSSDFLSHHELRETAVAFNRLLSREQFWDGRASSLEDQIRVPLENKHEMQMTAAAAVARISAIEGYRLQFEAIFGKLDFASLCQAIAAFERAIVTGPSPWDYDVELQRLTKLDANQLSHEEQQWLETVRAAAQQQPLSDAARRGAELFFSARTDCSRCHSGPNFTDEQYHDIGLRAKPNSKSPVAAKVAADLGRYEVTKDDADRYAFKTPTLRNVALTWPYFHDGRHHQLSDAVQHFVRGGDDGAGVLQPLELSATEVQDLIAFLTALTGQLPKPPTDRLPP